MDIQWFRSATVGVFSTSGSSILCDPWMTDGAFLGSWYHFPQLEGFEFQALLDQKWDALYISHIHADHFDRKFVSALARAQPDCVAIIPDFAHTWLRRALENCGFSGDRLQLLPSGTNVTIGDITTTVFVADHCDPDMCGVSLPCHNQDPRMAAFDSIAIFEADGNKIVNANDALAVASTAKVLERIGAVDLLLGHYGGAGPFPQTFVDIPRETKKARAATLAQGFLRRLTAAADALDATYVMPFAGHYVLGGRLAALNEYRSVVTLSEAIEWLGNKSQAQPVAMAPFGRFDVATGQASSRWEEPSPEETKDYLARISRKVFPYEKPSPEWRYADEELEEALSNVADEYRRRLSLGEPETSYRLSIETDRVSGLVDFDGKTTKVQVGTLPAMLDNETRLSCHANLLKGLIQRAPGFSGFTPMHFNQAEIGSHFEWQRNGEFNEIVRCLNFMQAGQTIGHKHTMASV